MCHMNGAGPLPVKVLVILELGFDLHCADSRQANSPK